MMAGGARVRQRPRQARDWYPTPVEVTRALARRHGFGGVAVWEPCCGDNAMADVLAGAGARVVSSDIAPLVEGAETLDFLAATGLPTGVTAIVTNPPFKLAAQFIRHALSLRPRFCAILLKSTFWHAVTRRGLYDAHPPSYIHPLTWRPDFLGFGRPTMECMWTVWIEGQGPTVYEPMHRA